jgi:hypothetical protein
MKFWALTAFLWATACQQRTEVVIGVATDIAAPGVIDTVQLSAARDGVPLFSNEWQLSGLTGQPYELPGSFGLNSPDGSEPRVEVNIVGLKDRKPVLTRQALMSLVTGKTLFMRMALVERCIQVVCKAGFTCIEGTCQDSTVDARTLPAHTADLEKNVSCSSGTQFVNTSTKAPLPVLGSGLCKPDETCSEGLCYLPPGGQG